MEKRTNDSKYFHCKLKGCEIVDKNFPHTNKDGKIVSNVKGKFCVTHQIGLCKCGWQWHWHYKTYSYPEKH